MAANAGNCKCGLVYDRVSAATSVRHFLRLLFNRLSAVMS